MSRLTRGPDRVNWPNVQFPPGLGAPRRSLHCASSSSDRSRRRRGRRPRWTARTPPATGLDVRAHRRGEEAREAARSETRLYLSEHDTIERETPLRDPDPATAPERTARALERSAGEPLALDQTRKRHDANARLHAHRQQQLERQRERAAERLATAQRDLKQLGWWSRGNRRVELEREISLQQTALRGFDEMRAELARTPPAVPRVPLTSRERDELTPSRSLRPEPPLRRTLHRELPSRGVEL
jgi:hypothetical protein